METTFVKFSRPIFIKTELYPEDKYEPVYGFVLRGGVKKQELSNLEGYVGFLAAVSEWSNGSKLFKIDTEVYGCSAWIDREGYVHPKQDDWCWEIGRKCVKKLNLTYSFITVDVDEEFYSNCINSMDMINCDGFFQGLDNYLEGNSDDLPF